MIYEIEESLKNIGLDISIGEEEDLEEYFSDSIIFISFIIELEQMFEIEIPGEYLEIDNFRNIEMIKQSILEIKKNVNEI